MGSGKKGKDGACGVHTCKIYICVYLNTAYIAAVSSVTPALNSSTKVINLPKKSACNKQNPKHNEILEASVKQIVCVLNEASTSHYSLSWFPVVQFQLTYWFK